MSSNLRIHAVAVLLGVGPPDPAARAQSTVHTGSLGSGDPTLDSGEWYDEYNLAVEAGQEVIAILTSVEFDPYLIVIAPSGEQHENDDHGDSADVSLVQVTADESGTWRVRATSFEEGESGGYALVATVRARTDGETTDEEFTISGTIPGDRTVSVNGTIDGSDPVRDDGSSYEAWSIDLETGTNLLVLLTSTDFDAYLTLVSPAGRSFSDDDGAGGTDSRLETTVDEAGRWTVVANTLQSGETGEYTLSVQRR
jgi:hypothetical protein